VKKSTILIITICNLLAVVYMGYLVSKLYHKPEPKVVATPLKTEPPPVEEVLEAIDSAESFKTVREAANQLPSPLEPASANQIIDWLLDPEAFDYLRASQKIELHDLLARKVAHPESLTGKQLERLAAAVRDPGRDLIFRETVAGLIFNIALARRDAEAEAPSALPVAIALIDSMEAPLEPIRLRAARLFNRSYPEHFSNDQLESTIKPVLQHPYPNESELLEVLPALQQLPEAAPDAWLLELIASDRSRAIKSEALRVLSNTGGIEEARGLILLPESDDLSIMRMRHRTAETILKRAQKNEASEEKP